MSKLDRARPLSPVKNAGRSTVRRSLPDSTPVAAQPNGLDGNQAVQRLIINELEQSQGAGQPLSSDVRAFFQSRFTTDFNKVRVHTDDLSTRASHELNADAFTIGSDVYFADGKYDPHSLDGRRLLAHELTHVVQDSSRVGAADLPVSSPSDAHEQEAYRVADAVFRGESIEVSKRSGESATIHRQANQPPRVPFNPRDERSEVNQSVSPPVEEPNKSEAAIEEEKKAARILLTQVQGLALTAITRAAESIRTQWEEFTIKTYDSPLTHWEPSILQRAFGIGGGVGGTAVASMYGHHKGFNLKTILVEYAIKTIISKAADAIATKIGGQKQPTPEQISSDARWGAQKAASEKALPISIGEEQEIKEVTGEFSVASTMLEEPLSKGVFDAIYAWLLEQQNQANSAQQKAMERTFYDELVTTWLYEKAMSPEGPWGATNSEDWEKLAKELYGEARIPASGFWVQKLRIEWLGMGLPTTLADGWLANPASLPGGERSAEPGVWTLHGVSCFNEAADPNKFARAMSQEGTEQFSYLADGGNFRLLCEFEVPPVPSLPEVKTQYTLDLGTDLGVIKQY